jgi:hypothetical protein
MNLREQPTPATSRHSEGELGFYGGVVKALEGKPAYVLLFGIAVLFVISGVSTSIAGVVRGQMWQSVIGLLSFVAALIAVFLVINRVEEPHLQPARDSVQVQLNHVRGKIDTPTPGQIVGRKIDCSGSATNLGPGLHLWLATEVHGLLWPKGSEVHVDSDGRWSKTIFEDGAIKEFSLSLFVANAEAHNSIIKWLQAGQQAHKYEELSGVIGTDRLDRVDDLSLSRDPIP